MSEQQVDIIKRNCLDVEHRNKSFIRQYQKLKFLQNHSDRTAESGAYLDAGRQSGLSQAVLHEIYSDQRLSWPLLPTDEDELLGADISLLNLSPQQLVLHRGDLVRRQMTQQLQNEQTQVSDMRWLPHLLESKCLAFDETNPSTAFKTKMQRYLEIFTNELTKLPREEKHAIRRW